MPRMRRRQPMPTAPIVGGGIAGPGSKAAPATPPDPSGGSWRPGQPIDPNGSWSSDQMNWLMDTPEGQNQMRLWNKPPGFEHGMIGGKHGGNKSASMIAGMLGIPFYGADGNWSLENALPWNAFMNTTPFGKLFD